MNASLYMPVRVLAGRGILAQNADKLALGHHALIVTGRNSARLCGALDDVIATLEKVEISYTVFDQISENPPLLTCYEGGQIATRSGADFVIGIGGGSPLDAAKAIAAFAANPTLVPMDVYDSEKRVNVSLPIVAIPTTAGTGSEVNPYSVLTLPDGERKKTFTADCSWPQIAFVDPKYTDSLPHKTTVSTALDAFAHAMESYLSPKSTVYSEQMALLAAGKIWAVLSERPVAFTEQMRDALSVASTAAGIAISVTGTGFPHPLGYSLTLLDGVPHGRACAVFAGAYITYNQKSELGREKLDRFAAACGTTAETLAAQLPILSEVEFSFADEEIERRVLLIENAKNYSNSPYVISKDEMREIYKNLFQK
ncbi:MAG: iron-containing alcohol dehydrogenase [Clostridia bacterium]|nr:iron-containing alcohol dehydrogenase [Clostridia bacterium]